ncbi:MAG: hypothetical protein TR69_WS6001000889 [candidate division WS6 bacterium OLB20]|uniref:Uncharacterized protein n=1 Tax=candidate division WS6 bacterium OLB20 TaxID=1617426 RepID=A0A136LYY3_9BACT|nr:MAG: hypothetical protein TR69_WS6001000889 [candidate division WS6 bacterium OLB20]
MSNKQKEALWKEFLVREISTQCTFAIRSFESLEPKVARNTDLVFSSIHSFLTHCAMVSKLLKANPQNSKSAPYEETVASLIGVKESSSIHKRSARNRLEHYDEHVQNG